MTRDLNSINDDKYDIKKIKEKKLKTTYFNNKLKNDYCSKVECLPNSLTNNVTNKQIVRRKSYNNFYYRNKNEFDTLGYRSKIKRNKKNYNGKERPFSSDRFNYNSNYQVKINYNAQNNNSFKPNKNKESYQNFYMLKPSSIFEKKYEVRFKDL